VPEPDGTHGIGDRGADGAEASTTFDLVLRKAEAARAEQPHQDP